VSVLVSQHELYTEEIFDSIEEASKEGDSYNIFADQWKFTIAYLG
jgi:hypothetical protein